MEAQQRRWLRRVAAYEVVFLLTVDCCDHVAFAI